MTTPTPNPPYQPWPPQPTPPAVPPKRKSRVGLIVTLAIAAAVVIVGGIIALGLALGGGQPTAKPASAWDREQSAQKSIDAQPTTPVELTTTAPAGPVLTADQVQLSLKTTEKACFGSAGCNVTVKVQMAYDGEPLDAGTTWEVTYEITGGDDGPQIGSFDVTGSQYDVNTELLSTKSKTTKLHVKVTDVDKLGI